MTNEEYRNLPVGTEIWSYVISLDMDYVLNGLVIQGKVIETPAGFKYIQTKGNDRIYFENCYRTKEQASKQLICALGDIEMSAMRQAEKLKKDLREQS